MKNEISVFIDEVHSSTIGEEQKQTDDISVDRDLATYPDSIRKETLRRAKIIRWIRRRLTGGWTEKNLRPLIPIASKELNMTIPSVRTLANWWCLYFYSGYKLTSLIPKHHLKGNINSRFTESDEVFFEAALGQYLVSERTSIAKAYDFYKSKVTVKNDTLVGGYINCLSQKGFYNRINRMPKYDVMVARLGKRRADIEFNSIYGHLPPQRVLEKVEIDHTPLDLILIDDELLVPLGRPYLTLLIDCYSRCIVGFYFGFKEPGYESVRKAIMNALKPKCYIKDKFPEIVNDWPCYGKIENLVVDNAGEFWCDSLEQACLEVGINVQYNPVQKPWLKPFVERFFGTMNSKFLVDIPGKTFSNILQRCGYNSAKDAIMRFSTFNMLFHKWVVDIYNREHDSRMRYIPSLSWETGLAEFPPVRYVPQEQAQLEIIMGISAKPTHWRGGIHIHCLRYDSDELAQYRKESRVVGGNNLKVLVKTNPDDISFIYVYLEKRKKYLKVPCVDPIGYTIGLTLIQHKINRKLQRDFISKKIDLVGLAQARLFLHDRIKREIDEIKNGSSKRSIKSMAKLAKYQGVASDSCGTVVPDELPKMEVMKLEKPEQTKLNNDDWDDLVSDLEPY